MFIGRSDAETEAPILCQSDVKRLWCWERLKAGEGGDIRGWHVWMASLTQWTWVRASFRRWWRTGKPGMMQSMGSQRVGLNNKTKVVKNLPANAGDTGSILGSGRFPGVGNSTYSSILTWKIPWTEEPGRLHTVHVVTELSMT